MTPPPPDHPHRPPPTPPPHPPPPPLRNTLALSLIAAALLAGCATPPPPAATGPVKVRVLAINDFHGNLRPASSGLRIADPANPGKTMNVAAGGAEHLATAVAELRKGHPNHVFVAAGDLIGATPLLSALFRDEPTIESLNLMGLEISAVGNHEFDKGADELLRLQRGGCHPGDGCKGPQPFKGARFQYLAASTVVEKTGQTLLPPYKIKQFQGIPVAFIGLTLKATPDLAVAAQGDVIIVVPPSQFLKGISRDLAAAGVRAGVPLVCCTKGLEHHTGRLMTQVLGEFFPDNPVTALSGPNHAEEVARGTPAAAVLAADNHDLAAGLSGLGDLIVTCFSVHSRNRGLGERLGRGESLADIQKSMVMVAEGVPTARSAHEEARKTGVDTPLLDTVHAVLFDGLSPRGGLLHLLSRDTKREHEPAPWPTVL